MDFAVKNTTKISFLDLLCPYTCRGCGRMGELFCGCCKNYIKMSILDVCVNCKQAKCDCKMPFNELFAVGWREGALSKLVEEYKYKSIRGAAKVIAELLNEAIGNLGDEVAIVPLPTISQHIRARGFDHTLKVAKELAKLRGWKVERALTRINKTVQVGSDEKLRIKQAKHAYKVTRKISSKTKYLLLDDIWTTGASMKTAAKRLSDAGAGTIYGAIVAVSR